MSLTLPEPPDPTRRRATTPTDRLLESFMDALFEPIAPGVEGLVRGDGATLEIIGIRALRPGNGDVGRFLDSLPTDRDVLVPSVIEPKLAAMLRRRGFTEPPTIEHPVLGTVTGRDSWWRAAR